MTEDLRDRHSVLLAEAEDFASKLYDVIDRTVVSDVSEFSCKIAPTASRDGTAYAVIQSEPSPQIALECAGLNKAVFSLSIEYRLFLGDYLTVNSSKFHVGLLGEDEPLFRYEFERRPRSSHLPAAHFHVHAHRDQFLHGMMQAGRGRPQQRLNRLDRGKLPYLSQLHFPLGGSRFRPTVEDVIQMLIEEFSVQAKENALQILQEERRKWRLIQLKALMGRNMEDVKRFLDERGYDVVPREDAQTFRTGDDPALTLY